LLFQKIFKDIGVDDLAPGAGDAEFYIDRNSDYAELETQGRYKHLKTNDSLEYETIWHVQEKERIFKSSEEITPEKIAAYARQNKIEIADSVK